MKLATLKNGTRDGQLVVVSKDLSVCSAVKDIAPTLQFALDQWAKVESQLNEVYLALNEGRVADSMPFNQEACGHHYHVPINGPMAVPTSIMSN